MIVNWVESVVDRNLARSLAEEVSVSQKKKEVVCGSRRTFAVVVRSRPAKMAELRHRGPKDTDPTVQQQPSEDKVTLAWTQSCHLAVLTLASHLAI